MIPKVIHYCWFGNNPLPDLAVKCIESWKKNCPDYEIKEWNESNFDINLNEYVKEAYNAKKYAFVTDYARLWILYNYGGIYFDTDVELIKSIDDLLQYKSFFASEDNVHISTGLGCGSIKGNSLVKRMLDEYDDIHFLLDDGSCDTITCPIRNTEAINEQFMNKIPNKNEKAIVEKNAYFPREYFCPIDNETGIKTITENTFSIHWFSGSWVDEKQKLKNNYYRKCNRLFGKKIGPIIAKITWYLTHSRSLINKIRK